MQHHRRNCPVASSERVRLAPSRTFCAALTTSLRMIRLAITSAAIASLHQRHAAAGEDRQGRGEARGVGGTHQPTDQRHAQQEAMPALAKGILAQRVAEADHPADRRDEGQRAPGLDPVADADQHAGQQRQRLPAVDEHPDHVGHHVAQQEADDGQRSDHQDHRIEQRQLDLLPRLLALLGVGKLLQHRAEVPGMLAGSHRRPVQLGKGGGKLAQAAGQAVAFEDLGAHREEHRLDALRGGLPRRRAAPRSATRPGPGWPVAGSPMPGRARTVRGRTSGARPACSRVRVGFTSSGANWRSRSNWRTWRALSASSTPFCWRPLGSRARYSKAAIILPGSRAGLPRPW